MPPAKAAPAPEVATQPPAQASLRLRFCICALCCLAGAYFAGSILWHILRYGVQVPFWDDWNFIGDFESFAHAKLSVNDLILMQAGEHRIGLQVIGSILLWRLTGMNFRLMMMLNWSLSLAVTLLASLIIRKSLRTGAILSCAVWAMASLFIFNPAAYQLWLWGIPPVYLIVPLLFLAGAHVAQYSISIDVRIACAAVAALLASFSFGAGVLLWTLFPFVLISIIGRRQILKARWAIGAYALLFMLTTYIYSRGIATYSNSEPAIKTTLGGLISFFFAYTGNLVEGLPVNGIVNWAQAMGWLILLLFVLSATSALRICRRSSAWIAAVICICTGIYAILAGVLVSAARIRFGVQYAVESSRYVLSSAIFPVVISTLMCICLIRFRSKLPPAVTSYSVNLVALTLLITASLVIRAGQSPPLEESFRLSRVHELQGKVAISAANFLPLPEYRYIFPHDNWSQFQKLANFITAESRGRWHMWDAGYIRSLPRIMSSGRFGFVDRLSAEGDKIVLRGWAYIENRREAADAVIVVGEDSKGQVRLLAVGFPSQARPDVSSEVGDSEGLAMGWATTIARSDPLVAVYCYAYDAENERAYLLGGPTHLPQ